jgi:hypothetical protein
LKKFRGSCILGAEVPTHLGVSVVRSSPPDHPGSSMGSGTEMGEAQCMQCPIIGIM